MIITVEYEKNLFTLRQFENKLSDILKANDGLEFFSVNDCYERNSLLITMRFNGDKMIQSDIVTFGPDKMSIILDQMNSTIEFAKSEQNKNIMYSDVRLLAHKVSRVVGFLILQKSKELINGNEKQETKKEENKENKKETIKSNRKSKQQKFN